MALVGLHNLRTMLINAKGSLLGTAMPGQAKLHQLVMHRAVEKQIWGSISEIPGEQDFLNSMQLPSRRDQEGKPPLGS